MRCHIIMDLKYKIQNYCGTRRKLYIPLPQHTNITPCIQISQFLFNYIYAANVQALYKYIYYSISTSWRRRRLKRVPRSDLDQLILCAFYQFVWVLCYSILNQYFKNFRDETVRMKVDNWQTQASSAVMPKTTVIPR